MSVATVTSIKPEAKPERKTATRKPVQRRLTPAERAAEAERLAHAARVRKALRVVAIIGAIPVVAVAFDESYFHIVKLAVEMGQSQSGAHVLPLAIDGFMMVAAVAMLALPGAKMPWLCFAAGALVTLMGNALSVHPSHLGWYAPVAYVLAGWPAGALVLSAEMLLRSFLPPAPVRSRARRTAR